MRQRTGIGSLFCFQPSRRVEETEPEEGTRTPVAEESTPTAQAAPPPSGTDTAAAGRGSTVPAAPTPPPSGSGAAAPPEREGAQAAAEPTPTPKETDPYAAVAELDFDEIVRRHPRAGRRLEALATKKAHTLQEARDAETRRATEQEQRTRARDLWRKWKTQGDSDAGAALIDLLGAPIDQEVSEEAYAPKVAAARDETRRTIWEQHAQSFGLDPGDEEVAEAISEAKDFKSLNGVLLRLARDTEAVESMWLHPEIQKRHKAALADARQAGTINGQASVIGEKALDVGPPSGGGRPQTADEVIEEYALVWSRGQKPSAELTEAYRRATGRPTRSTKAT